MAVVLMRIKLTKADLLKLSAAEQRLFLIAGHISNEIGTLPKLLLGCLNYSPKSEAGLLAANVQAWAVATTLTGKLHEAWEAMRKYYYSSPCKDYSDLLPNEAKDAEKTLSRYFGKSNPISRVRNEAAFHYSCERASEAINGIADHYPLSMFIGKNSGNSLHHCCEDLLFAQLFPRTPHSGVSQDYRTFTQDTAKVARMFTTFLDGCMLVAVTEKMGLKEQPEVETVPESDVAHRDEFVIPYFVDATPVSQSA